MPAGLAQKVSASLPSAPPQKILPFVSVILDSAGPGVIFCDYRNMLNAFGRYAIRYLAQDFF